MARAIDANKAIEVAQIKYNDWNFAMAAADGQREINLCFKKQELFKAVKAVIECVPTLTPQNEWISVEERLPEGHMQVLMWSARWKIAEAGSYYNKHFWVYTEIGDGYIADNITHWMPLPKSPDRRPPEREEA